MAFTQIDFIQTQLEVFDLGMSLTNDKYIRTSVGRPLQNAIPIGGQDTGPLTANGRFHFGPRVNPQMGSPHNGTESRGQADLAMVSKIAHFFLEILPRSDHF